MIRLQYRCFFSAIVTFALGVFVVSSHATEPIISENQKRLVAYADNATTEIFTKFSEDVENVDLTAFLQAERIENCFSEPIAGGISTDQALEKALLELIANGEPSNITLPKAYQLLAEHALRELNRRANDGDVWAQLGLVRICGLRQTGRHVVEKFEGVCQPPEAAATYEMMKLVALSKIPGPTMSEAQAMLDRAVASGQPRALAIASSALSQGWYGTKDAERSNELRGRALAVGDPLAMQFDAYRLLDSDPPAALRLLRQAIKAGYASSAWWAYSYARLGKFGPVEESETKEWLSRAKEMECPEAMLAGMHEGSVKHANTENPTPADLAGFRLIEKTIPLIMHSEQYPYSLAIAAKWGIGCPKSPKVATASFLIAAEKGNPEAFYEVGLALMNGSGTEKNIEKAVHWLEKAARNQDTYAYALLLEIAEDGNASAAAKVAALKTDAVKLDDAWAHKRVALRKEQRTKIQVIDEKTKQNAAVRKALEERKKEIAAEKSILLDEKAALESSIGGGKWPPPDIVFASPEDWHRQMSQAQALSKPDFINRVKTVRIHLRASSIVTKLIPKKELWLMAAKAVRASGFEVDPQAKVALEIGLFPKSVENITRQNDIVVGRTTLSTFITQIRFSVPARIMRDGDFYHQEVSPVTVMAYRGQNGEYDAATLKRLFATIFVECIASLREPLEPLDVEKSKPNIGPISDAGTRFAAYQKSRRDREDEFVRPYSGLKKIREVKIYRQDQAAKFATENSLKKQWGAALEGNGFSMNADASGFLQYSFYATYSGPVSALEALVTDLARDHWTFVQYLEMRDSGAVYDLDGTLYRGVVNLSNDVVAGYGQRLDGPVTFQEKLDSLMDDFVTLARSRK